MATRKRSKTQSRNSRAVQTRKNLTRLKDLGLISKKQKVGKRATEYQKQQLWKFRTVLQKKASVAKVPKTRARQYRDAGFVVRGSSVVVPRKRKGEKITVDREGFIVARSPGQRRIIAAGDKVPKKRKGVRRMYGVPFSNGGVIRFESLKQLREFMAQYQSYKNWRAYLEITELDGDDTADDGEE